MAEEEQAVAVQIEPQISQLRQRSAIALQFAGWSWIGSVALLCLHQSSLLDFRPWEALGAAAVVVIPGAAGILLASAIE